MLAVERGYVVNVARRDADTGGEISVRVVVRSETNVVGTVAEQPFMIAIDSLASVRTAHVVVQHIGFTRWPYKHAYPCTICDCYPRFVQNLILTDFNEHGTQK